MHEYMHNVHDKLFQYMKKPFHTYAPQFIKQEFHMIRPTIYQTRISHDTYQVVYLELVLDARDCSLYRVPFGLIPGGAVADS